MTTVLTSSVKSVVQTHLTDDLNLSGVFKNASSHKNGKLYIGAHLCSTRSLFRKLCFLLISCVRFLHHADDFNVSDVKFVYMTESFIAQDENGKPFMTRQRTHNSNQCNSCATMKDLSKKVLV